MTVVDDLFDVRGQVALVTGGASGLGYAFASILAEAGATVVIADWNAESLEKAVRALADAAAAARAGDGVDRGVDREPAGEGVPRAAGRGRRRPRARRTRPAGRRARRDGRDQDPA